MNNTTGSSSEIELVFLKLGGSLITDKGTPRTSRPEVIDRICGEIKSALDRQPGLRVLLGHGSGSFGHYSGSKYNTRQGVRTPAEWEGFTEVWRDAAALNHQVMASLQAAGLPAVAFPPSAGVISGDRIIATWNLEPIRTALSQRLLPVVYGDVVFDTSLGGTILSTEDLFIHLAEELQPSRILLAGLEPGVWKDYPDNTALFEVITPAQRDRLDSTIGQSSAMDVTGGMADKVDRMLDLISRAKGLEVEIFSGEQPRSVLQALQGQRAGTRLRR